MLFCRIYFIKKFIFVIFLTNYSSPHTPDSILREFRATADKRVSKSELLLLLESISCKRPNYRELLEEIKYILER